MSFYKKIRDEYQEGVQKFENKTIVRISMINEGGFTFAENLILEAIGMDIKKEYNGCGDKVELTIYVRKSDDYVSGITTSWMENDCTVYYDHDKEKNTIDIMIETN